MESVHSSKKSIDNVLAAISGSLFLVTVAVAMICVSGVATHAEGEDEDLGYGINSGNASVTVGTACTFSASITNPHTSTISNGLSSNNIGTTILNTTCNDSGGYAVYAIGYTNEEYGNTSLTYSSLDSTLENPITNSNYDISTGTATSGNTSNWAMKLSTVSGTTTATIENGYNNYSIVPDDYAKVATLSTVTDGATASPATGSSISTTYQAYISPTQAPGTYTGKVKYTLVHPSTAPRPEIPKTINDLTYMQDFAGLSSGQKTSLLNSMALETTYTLKDKRDEQDYTIAKLKDGKIWMTKNLNLAGGAEITSELSNVPDGYTLPTANGFQSGNKLPVSSTSGFSDNTQAYVYNSTKTSGTDCTSPGCYSYYSWTAATAGSGLSIDKDDTDAPYSICPKGWKLPNSRSTVADNSDFYQLAIAYGMAEGSFKQYTSDFYSQAGPGTVPNFLLTGRYKDSSFGDGGSYGNYWSSTSDSGGPFARNLYFYSSYVCSAYGSNRRYGYAVRCVAE